MLEEFIQSRHLDADFAARLRSYPPGLLDELLASLQPSGNALRSLLQLLEEISRRDRLSLASLLEQEQLQAVLLREELNRKDRLRLYREVLEQLRYPELSRIRQELAGAVSELQRDCKLFPQLPKDLEGDTLEVTFSFRTPEELELIGQRCSAAAKHPALERVFRLLCGSE